MVQRLNLLGEKFGRLVVEAAAGTFRQHSLWQCRCNCGIQIVVEGSNLRSGNSKSCGCTRKISNQANFQHGHSPREGPTKEYICWSNMVQRCTNPKNNRWSDYGGRGIVVCETWQKSFSTFLAEMGKAPGPAYSIDRIDPNGNYEFSNCRWATIGQQRHNR